MAKLPTAKKPEIGTKKADFAGFLILSKRFGDLDTHFNLGYTVYGQPSGVSTLTENTVDSAVSVAAAAVYTKQDWQVFGEIFSNALSGGGNDGADSTLTVANPAIRESGSGETIGTIGVARVLTHGFKPSLSVSYDNNRATLIRLGAEYRF